MNKILRNTLGWLAGLSMAMACQAAPLLAPGQTATPEQLAQWGELPSYDVGAIPLRRIPGQPGDGQGTLLLNAQNVVGVSRNEVTVANASEEQVKAVASRAAHAPVSLRHYAPTGMTVLRYADFDQAVEGLNVLNAGLPGATVRLPVQFDRPMLN